MKWSDEAWSRTDALYQQIIQMPFIQELKAGTLPLSKFQFYMQQDACYLEHFSRVLAHIGSRSTSNTQALDFYQFASEALIVEKALHENYFKLFHINEAHPDSVMQPVCHHYTHYLKSVASFDDFSTSVAAVLPCFGVYKKVGDYILSAEIREDHPYKTWIDTYSGAEFSNSVERAFAHANAIAYHANEYTQNNMWQIFEQSVRMEYLFWEAAYNLKRW